ncbi:MAG: hypothetical protein ACKVIS_11085 [Pseudomonadales bacterium]
MSEQMQPIDPVTAALLMGQVPEPCEPTIEISHKVLTRLMDVVEFGDQLERVEKDRLLAHLKEVLAADQPVLWAMHSPGPGEVHPVISKEEAERQQSELLALCKKQFPEISITVNVIPSPFSPLEHFEILAGELSEQVKHLQDYVKGLEGAAKALATDATLDKFRASGLSIDGDNAYKRDLLDAVVGAMMLGRLNTKQPPADHWAQRFWDIGREYGEAPVTAPAIVLPMPVMPEQPEDAIDDSWMDGYNAALRMREECQRAIEAAGMQAAQAAPAEPCNHEWIDDGQHLLVCTSCGAQEDHDPRWRDMATAPRDGTMVRLLVEFTEHATDDADQAPTIGANNFENDGEDRWQFAGWCWSHDHFTEGKGEPIGWLPMLDEPRSIAPEQLEQQP